MARLFDHINLLVSDLEKSRALYTELLAPMGLKVLVAEEEVVGFGRQSWDFGIEISRQPIPPVHLAFAATSIEAVEQFYSRAIALGARDNGTPGWRPEYGSDYFAAFILDPDDHNIEMVYRGGSE